jgi:hypothetical protein
MTLTTIYHAVSLGNTTDLINNSPTKVTLATGTTSVILNMRVINGTNSVQGDLVELCYAIVPFNLTADATLPDQLKPLAGSLTVQSSRQGLTPAIIATGVIANNGGYLYTWFNSPALGAGATITVVSVELP